MRRMPRERGRQADGRDKLSTFDGTVIPATSVGPRPHPGYQPRDVRHRCHPLVHTRLAKMFSVLRSPFPVPHIPSVGGGQPPL